MVGAIIRAILTAILDALKERRLTRDYQDALVENARREERDIQRAEADATRERMRDDVQDDDFLAVRERMRNRPPKTR